MFKIKPIKWNIFVLLKKKLMERITSFCGSFLKAPLICTRKTLLDQIVPMHKKLWLFKYFLVTESHGQHGGFWVLIFFSWSHLSETVLIVLIGRLLIMLWR